MELILTSFGHEQLPDFILGRTLAYIPDAARTLLKLNAKSYAPKTSD